MSNLRVTLSKNALFYYYIVVMALLKIPPFYYYPISNRLFSSHTLVKELLIILLLLTLLTKHKLISFVLNKKKLVLIILLFFFFTQSISIINAKDLVLFGQYYHNLILFIVVFFLSLIHFSEKQNKRLSIIINLILILGVVLILGELLIFYSFNYLEPLIKSIFQNEYLDALLVNIARGRNTLISNNELFIPFFLSCWLLNQRSIFRLRTTKLLCQFFTLILFFQSFFSSNRTRFVVALFIMIAYSTIIKYWRRTKKNYKKFKPGYYLIIIFLVFVAANSTRYIFNTVNIVERVSLSLNKDSSDFQSSTYRIEAVDNSISVLKSSPVIGVGLGNYVFYSNSKTDLYGSSLIATPSQKNFMNKIKYSPHNIFSQTIAETGIIGLLGFSLLIAYFLIGDINLIKNRRINLLAFIISSWVVFIPFLFNPHHTLFVSGWFWFFRGIIEAVKN